MDLIIPSLPDIGNGTFLDEKVQKDSNLDLRVWHVIFMGMGVFFSVVVMLCCCFRFRIPRTKQDIEADYQRRIIAKKFREKLEKIKNTEMENMDLPRALERIQSAILLDSFDSPVGECKDDAKLIPSAPSVHKKRESPAIHV